MSEALAKADYRFHGTGHNGKPVSGTVHAELHKSGAFQYGNGTCIHLNWSDEDGWTNEESYDTRYEKVNVENFTEFAKKVIESQVLDTIKVEAI